MYNRLDISQKILWKWLLSLVKCSNNLHAYKRYFLLIIGHKLLVPAYACVYMLGGDLCFPKYFSRNWNQKDTSHQGTQKVRRPTCPTDTWKPTQQDGDILHDFLEKDRSKYKWKNKHVLIFDMRGMIACSRCATTTLHIRKVTTMK